MLKYLEGAIFLYYPICFEQWSSSAATTMTRIWQGPYVWHPYLYSSKYTSSQCGQTLSDNKTFLKSIDFEAESSFSGCTLLVHGDINDKWTDSCIFLLYLSTRSTLNNMPLHPFTPIHAGTVFKCVTAFYQTFSHIYTPMNALQSNLGYSHPIQI